MANLRVNKITGTEVFETTGSVQFDGTGDFLSLADSADFDFGSGDFTVEGWIYLIGNGEAYIVGQSNSVGANSSCAAAIVVSSTNILIGRFFNGSDFYETTHSVLQKNVWNHFALVRNGSSGVIYLNGIAGTPINLGSIALNNSSNQMSIGRIGEYDSRYFNGHISNLRIIKGTALYTKNFTPPTRELTVIPNTVLLCCQSTTRVNEERTGKTITVNGNAVANELTPGLLTDRVKSGGDSAISGSVEFDGTGDYLLDSTGADGFNGGVGDWTVEAWMYCTDASHPDVLINGKTSTTDRFYINFIGQTIYIGDFNINNIAIGGVKQVNSWFHITVTKNSSTYRAFINGIQIGSSTTPLANYNLDSLTVGYRGSQGYYTKGFISNLRIIKGTALYTSNFIPPTRKLTRLPGTVLLCCQDNASATTEATGKTITANGNPTARKFVPQVGSDGGLVFDGVTKVNTQNYFYLPTGPTEQRGRGRGVFSGGANPATVNTVEYITIFTTGNTIDFGDLTESKNQTATCSSSTRGIFGTGFLVPNNTNVIEYITIASTGNSLDFGDSTTTRRGSAGCSSPTRGIFGGGFPFDNVIEYITIASIGNAIDFGDLTLARYSPGACSSSTRGIFAGGTGTPGSSNIIDYITIASVGNAVDFGDSTQSREGVAGVSSAIRAVFGGGYSTINTLDYVTITTTGNAIDFGDLTIGRGYLGGCSSSIRGVFGGGGPGNTNTIDYITIGNTGNAIDFGDLISSRSGVGALSDSHGGLG